MSEQVFTSLGAALKKIARDVKVKEKRLRTAVRKTARAARNDVIRNHVPRAFGELADSIVVVDAVNGSAVVADAPHAAAVEVGSRPHTPPLAPLIAWVTLRGIQGLTPTGNVRSLKSNRVGSPYRSVGGSTAWAVKDWRKESARPIALQLRTALGRQGAAAWRQQAASAGSLGIMDADPAVVKIARAIQRSIAQHGTKPYRYMAKEVPYAADTLHTNIAVAIYGSEDE